MSLSPRFLPRALPRRTYSTTRILRQAISYTQTCPSPTCACRPMPPDLDIDHKTPLMHTMASYTEQVLICTGKDDWSSRIEDEQSPAGDFIRGLRGVIGRGGKGFDPFNNVLVTACSFPASDKADTTTALLFPSFQRISVMPNQSSTYSALATAYLAARKLHPAHAGLPPEQKAYLTRDRSLASSLPAPVAVTKPIILICGHGGRDERCGKLGPVLQSSFRDELARRAIDADVGLVSHVGGHKYAGNVIIYLPPSLQMNALKGSGIWYGRVRPEDVEGVVGETVVKGRIIADLLRGGITQDGGNLARILEAQMKVEAGQDGGLKLNPRVRA